MIEIILGIIGMVCILLAFILDEFVKCWNQNTIKYNLFNIAGSGLLIYYGVSIQGWPFVILNCVWLVVAVWKLALVLSGSVDLKKNKKRSA